MLFDLAPAVRIRINRLLMSSVCVALALCGCGPNKGYVRTSVRQDSIRLICEQRNIPWQWDAIAQVFSFTSRGTPAKVLVGSNLVLVGRERILLDGAVQRRDNTIVVPPDFIAKVFEKADQALTTLSVAPSFTGKYRTIMVDAGHGGKDPGAIGPSGMLEKDVVLDIALRLKSGLERMGFKVLMTRDSDEFISLAKRTEMASSSDADLFVSIHANSTRSKKIKGLEIYYSRPLDPASDLAQHYANERSFLERLNIIGDKAVPQRIVSSMMHERKHQESEHLADHLIRYTAQDVNVANRGSRKSGFFVVKNTLVPAVLLEVGYLSNAAEAKLLETEDYRQQIADAIAESIKGYSHES